MNKRNQIVGVNSSLTNSPMFKKNQNPKAVIIEQMEQVLTIVDTYLKKVIDSPTNDNDYFSTLNFESLNQTTKNVKYVKNKIEEKLFKMDYFVSKAVDYIETKLIPIETKDTMRIKYVNLVKHLQKPNDVLIDDDK